jgi:hypothetical protein
VGPQTNLVDHHRTHCDGVPTGSGPLGLDLLGHLPHLGDQIGHLGREVVDVGYEHVAFGSGMETWSSVSGPGQLVPAPGALSF